MNINIKRVYEPPSPEDGIRVLVDRLWPRGLSKDKAQIAVWLKTLAPSNELRKWYSHDSAKWPEFKVRYFQELDAGNSVPDELETWATEGLVTFL